MENEDILLNDDEIEEGYFEINSNLEDTQNLTDTLKHINDGE